jgi:ferredoxin
MTTSAAIFYFSGTGNTWWVANELKKFLEEKKCKTTIHSIEKSSIKKDEQKIISQADYVGFGFPIYASDMPNFFKEFIKQIPSMKEKKAFVFTTMEAFSGDGALTALRKLRRKDYQVNQAINIKMPNNVILPYIFFKNFPSHSQEQIQKRKKEAKEVIEKLAGKILSEEKWIQGRDPFSIATALIQRVPMRLIGWSQWARNFYVERDLCIECMKCVDFCPTNNITFENDIFSWGNDCTMCLRCYNLCPKNAIQYKEATLNEEKYPRYKGPGNGFSVKKLTK